ncbi:ABC transporter permease [Nocardia sp. NPDC020380]|uniref:ABC transporter permease n=1 Tax=Nocardia sp. NPDC020380 TaxID=3364309 RepID=UPI00378D0B03
MRTVQDVYIIFRNELAMTMRIKFALIIGLIQPFVYLLLFGPLLTRALPNGHDAWRFYIPGLLVQLGLFATGYAGFNLIPDMRSGFIERMRVTPVSRLALLLGRMIRDAVVLLIQAIPLLIMGFIMGMRAPILGVLIGLIFVLVMGVSLSALSYTLALGLPNEYLFAPVLNSVAVPLMLLSGILLPLSFAPKWLDWIAHANPLRYIVDAIRDLFAGQYTAGGVGIGVLVAFGLAILSTWYGLRIFNRRTA